MIMTKKLGYAALGAASLFAISLPFALSAGAQEDGKAAQQGEFQRTQGQPPQGGFQGNPPPAGPGGQFGQAGGQFRAGGGMGGGTAMESDNMYLYILQGNTVFKLSKADLKVLGQTQLMPMGGPPIRIEGQPVRPPAGGGGGGGGDE